VRRGFPHRGILVLQGIDQPGGRRLQLVELGERMHGRQADLRVSVPEGRAESVAGPRALDLSERVRRRGAQAGTRIPEGAEEPVHRAGILDLAKRVDGLDAERLVVVAERAHESRDGARILDFPERAHRGEPHGELTVLQRPDEAVDRPGVLDLPECIGRGETQFQVAVAKEREQRVHRLRILDLPERPDRREPEPAVAGAKLGRERRHRASILDLAEGPCRHPGDAGIRIAQSRDERIEGTHILGTSQAQGAGFTQARRAARECRAQPLECRRTRAVAKQPRRRAADAGVLVLEPCAECGDGVRILHRSLERPPKRPVVRFVPERADVAAVPAAPRIAERIDRHVADGRVGAVERGQERRDLRGGRAGPTVVVAQPHGADVGIDVDARIHGDRSGPHADPARLRVQRPAYRHEQHRGHAEVRANRHSNTS
jgi:hypothetical protein